MPDLTNIRTNVQRSVQPTAEESQQVSAGSWRSREDEKGVPAA